MANYTVHIPDNLDLPPGTMFRVVRAVLESVEPGSSKHCLEFHEPEGEGDTAIARHHRLGVSVTGRSFR